MQEQGFPRTSQVHSAPLPAFCPQSNLSLSLPLLFFCSFWFLSKWNHRICIFMSGLFCWILFMCFIAAVVCRNTYLFYCLLLYSVVWMQNLLICSNVDGHLRCCSFGILQVMFLQIFLRTSLSGGVCVFCLGRSLRLEFLENGVFMCSV